MKPFFKFLQKPRYHIHCSDLSPELAISILETELELEKKPTLEHIHHLTALYTRAIEHYESQDNPKYLDFQEKLQKMLLKPQNFAVLTMNTLPSIQTLPTNSETPKNSLKSPQKSSKELSESHRKQCSLRLSCTLDSSLSSEFLNSHSDSSKSTSEQAISVLKTQDSSLEAKVLARKIRRLDRKTSLSQIPDMSFLDQDSLLTTKSSLESSQDIRDGFDRYEKVLEKIMEENLAQRAWKVLETQKRFEKEIEEIRLKEHSNTLISQLEDTKRNQIKSIIDEFDKKRQNEIQKAKIEGYT